MAFLHYGSFLISESQLSSPSVKGFYSFSDIPFSLFSPIFCQSISLGAINALTHQIVTATNESYINAESFCELLDKLAALCLNIPITLILYNARYQKCHLVEEHA